MSLNAQVGLTLGMLLFFSMVFTLVGYLASNQERDKIAGLAREPVVAPGMIVGKHVDIVRPTKGATQVHWLDVSFPTESGTPLKQSQQVANTVYDRYDVGDPVKVTYVRSKPEWFFVPGTTPTARDVSMMDGMFEYGLMGVAVFLVGFLAWFFTSRRPQYR
jgi:hypothetical protein